MSAQQPEALQLAEFIEKRPRRSGDAAIAAELRRLQVAIDAANKAANDLAIELERVSKDRDYWHARLLGEVNKRNKTEEA